MEATRRQRIEDVVIGLVLMGASGLWTLVWGIVAALASGFGSDAFFWVIIAAALAAGIYVFFLGISFVRGSPSLGGIVRFGTIGLVVTLVLVVALDQARPVEESNSRPGDEDPAISRDGNWIAFTSERVSGDGIYIARLGASARRITDPGESTDSQPDWSPDGSRVVFARFGERGSHGLFVVNRDGSGLRQLTKRYDRSPSWSPAAKAIVFTRWGGQFDDDDVHVIDADGKNLRVLVRDAQDPAWSPDGSKIAFVRGGISSGDIAVFDLKSKSITRVVRSKRVSASDPAWSPDGRRIVFEDDSDVRFDDNAYLFGIKAIAEIYVVNVDGTGLRRLTKDREAYDVTPTWTPDGRIVFASDRVGPYRLYVMNSDGTGVRRFVPGREKKSH